MFVFWCDIYLRPFHSHLQDPKVQDSNHHSQHSEQMPNQPQYSTGNVGGKHSSPWVYLLDWILSLIVALAFLFFFSRLIGVLVTFVLKLFLWKRSKMRITVESLRISPLGGRIFAKNLVIITQDYTISVLALNFSWRYWIFRIIRISDFYYQMRQGLESDIPRDENEKLPCRFVLYLEGLEVFMYNRSFAYDNIEQMLSDQAKNRSETTKFSTTKTGPAESTSLSYLLRLMPIRVQVKKGTVILGNSTTPSIFVASYKSAYGIIDLHQSPCPLDYFRHVYNFSLAQFQLSMKPNISYDKSKYSKVKTSQHHKSSTIHLNRQRQYQYWHKFHQASKKAAHFLRPRKRRAEIKLEEASKEWRGLRRYIDNEPRSPNNIHLNMEEEYAKYSLILDSALTRFIYYFDSLGNFPQMGDPSTYATPEYGVDIELAVATIHYGPWADKQRVPLQQMFFPPLSRDSSPTPTPQPGMKRQYDGFKVVVSVKDELIFRIPIRESSKDKEIVRSHLQSDSGAMPITKIARSFGWLELKMAAKSSVCSYSSFTSTRENGWPNKLSLYLLQPELRSSVNHDILFTADTHIVDCDIGFPLKWNSPCVWKFANQSSKARLFLLREHIFLLSDLFADFASGPPPAYEYLRPFEYILDWNMDDYKLYLNVNDSNIIDNPLDFDSNKYLSFEGDRLEAQVAIPLNGNLTRSTTISYKIYTPALNAVLSTPLWHTVDAFSRSEVMGSSSDFTIDGSYTFFNIIDPTTSNHIIIRIVGDFVTLKFYGYLVRYLFTARENYFGDHVKFKTFEEYTTKPSESPENYSPYDSSSTLKTKIEDEDAGERFVKIENDLDVEFVFQVRHGLLLLPYNFYNTASHVAFNFDSFDIDLRFTNYYMDIQADFSPTRGVFVLEEEENSLIFDIPRYVEKYFKDGPEVLIDGLNVHAHRMFGPPPDQITYYCKWDFAAGSIEIDSQAKFLTGLLTSIKSFVFTFKDLENCLVPTLPVVHDAANFSFRCPSFIIKVRPAVERTGCPIIVVNLGSLVVSLNDLPNGRYNTRISAYLPEISVSVLGESEDQGKRKVLGYLSTSLNLSNFVLKANSLEVQKLQRQHVKFSDGPFHRCPFLLPPDDRDFTYKHALGSLRTNLTLPDVSIPLNRETFDAIDGWDDYLDSTWSTPSLSSNSSASMRSSFSFDDVDSSFDSFLYEYDDAEFKPEYEKSPDSKYANAIMQFGDIHSFITPGAVMAVVRLERNFKDLRIETVMDNIEFDIVNNIRRLILSLAADDCTRIVVPEVTFKVGEFETYNPRSVFDQPLPVPVLSLSLHEPSLALSRAFRYSGGDEALPSKSATLAGHLKEIFVSISNPSSFAASVSLRVTNTELWKDTDTANNDTSSVTIDEMDISLEESQVEFLRSYIEHMKEKMAPILAENSKQSNMESKAEAELVYKLTMASDQYKIDHDSAVLTKPAHVLRSVHDHVRTYDSWKVITRLRHVLSNMPSQWEKETNDKLENLQWEAPTTAYEDVLDVFSRWRSWEVDTSNGFLFKKVFNREMNAPNDNQTLSKFAVGNLVLSISKMNEETNRIFLNSSSVSLDMAKLIREVIKDEAISSTDEAVEILCQIGHYESFISSLSIDLLAACKAQSEPKPKEPKAPRTDSAVTQLQKQVLGIIKISSYDQTLKLLNSTVNMSGSNAVHALRLASTGDSNEITLSSQLATLDIKFSVGAESLASLSGENIRLSAATAGTLREGSKVLEVDADVISMHLLVHNFKASERLEAMIKVDRDYIEGLQKTFISEPSTSNHPPRAVEKSGATRKVPDICARLGIANFLFKASFMDPITLVSSSRDIILSVDSANGVQIVDFTLGSTELSTFTSRSVICGFENSDTKLNLLIKNNSANTMLDFDYSIGFTKISFPQVLQGMSELETSLPKLEARVNSLRQCFEVLGSKNPRTAEDTPRIRPATKHRKPVVFKSKFSIDYLSVSVGINNSKINFEFDNLSSSISTLQVTQREQLLKTYSIVPVYGDVTIPSTRVSLVDKLIPLSLSTVVDFNTSIKVSNDFATKGQTLQLESQYFRIVLSPQVVLKAIMIAHKLSKSFASFTRVLGESGLSKHLKREVPSHSPVKNPAGSDQGSGNGIFSRFVSVHVLSYNWCLGWIFRLQHKDYPGIIMGAERFFAVTEKDLGKFTLIDAYLSVANGTTSSNFFSTLSERISLNRAFLPNIQLCYFIDEATSGEKNLTIILTGDELDVCFLSTSVLLVERVLQSGNEVKRLLDKLRSEHVASAEEKQPEQRPFKPWFTSVEFRATFAGANMVLWSSFQVSVSDAPALSLHSPAVKFVTKYTHNKNGPKRHVIKSEVVASASDNTVYASCVPVMTEFANGFKQMMRTSSEDVSMNEQAARERRKLLITSSKSSMTNILQDFDVHVGIRFEKQRLALSCEPTARVEAVVGIDGIYIQINTVEKENTSITTAIRLNPLYASLQHIYSREISASLKISQVVFLSSVEMGKTTSVISSCSMSDVAGSVDAKQFQDVDLFKDIWFPKSLYKASSVSEPTPQSSKLSIGLADHTWSSRNISSRFKEVSTTYAIPWIFTLVVSNMSFQMDVGQLLGNFNLSLNNFWLVSKKSTDWAQDLKIGTDIVLLTSEGRLGGNIQIRDAFLHTAIRWKYGAEVLDIPLILVSGGIDSLQVKASFDYHVFAIIDLRGSSLDIYNQKNEHTISKDHLFVTANVESAELYMTSLAASNIIDINNAISRMIQENKRSYTETLWDSYGQEQKKNGGLANAASRVILETVKKLEFRIEVLLGNLRIYVYPSSLEDSKVLVMKIDQSRAHFQQTEITAGVSNQLDVKFSGIDVSLSVSAPIKPQTVLNGTVTEFVELAHKAKGGNIFVFPSLRICMRTYQKYESHEIEYLFQSAFGGTVEVKWNLGSVNFIREMYAIHKRAWLTRIKYRKEGEIDENALRTPLNEKQDMEQDINDTLAKVTEESSYKYTPLAPPIIEAPRLKELGNATPPLEWFGLHRNRFPDATHQLAIVTLQKFIHQIETQYSKILGKA